MQLLKSLLFAMLLSDGASEKPRLRGTSSDVNPPLPRDDDTIERAAVSNQFNPGPRVRDRERHEPSSVVPAVSRAMNQNPDPDSNDARVPFTTGPYRQNAPSRTRNLAHSAALDPPWRPNATSGTTRDCLHHRSSSSTTRPTLIPKANPCPKPYVKYGKFCCFGKPMEGNCYKWDD